MFGGHFFNKVGLDAFKIINNGQTFGKHLWRSILTDANYSLEYLEGQTEES